VSKSASGGRTEQSQKAIGDPDRRMAVAMIKYEALKHLCYDRRCRVLLKARRTHLAFVCLRGRRATEQTVPSAPLALGLKHSGVPKALPETLENMLVRFLRRNAMKNLGRV
jgi:hypothetical protein